MEKNVYEKITVYALVKKYHALWKEKPLILFRKPKHCALFWDNWLQYANVHHIPVSYTLASCTRICTQTSTFQSSVQKFRLQFFLQFNRSHVCPMSQSFPWFDQANYIWRRLRARCEVPPEVPALFLNFRHKYSPLRQLVRHSPYITPYFVR
jgi:hypothetical protein